MTTPLARSAAPLQLAAEQAESLVRVLQLVRSGQATTRPELGRVTGYGRTVIALRVQQLLTAGLIEEGSLASSTGGRAARRLVFSANAGRLLVAELGATHVSVGVATLQGDILVSTREPSQVEAGPDIVLRRMEELFDELMEASSVTSEQIWGVGIGVPGPVEFATGRPVSPPIMPGWDQYPIRERVAKRYDAPVWVDNDVNIMTIGEMYRGIATHESDVLFVKVSSGIGAGLVSNGVLHRGAQGAAGDVGHIEVEHGSSALCRCGNYGCLEAIAGGRAIVRAADRLTRDGKSDALASLLQGADELDFDDVQGAAAQGDPVLRALVTKSAETVGQMLATLVNFHNPALVVLGGQVALSSDDYLARVREAVLGRSLPLATRDLRIERSILREDAGLLGAAALVINELLGSTLLLRWINEGTPVGPDWNLSLGMAS